MLVLSRQELESVVIETPTADVVVTVVGIRRGVVRLGVEAPKHIPVHRGEVAEARDRMIPHWGTGPPPEVDHENQ